MIEVYKTTISDSEIAANIINIIQMKYPEAKITIDLEDCDKILRIENHEIQNSEIQQLVTEFGCMCEVL